MEDTFFDPAMQNWKRNIARAKRMRERREYLAKLVKRWPIFLGIAASAAMVTAGVRMLYAIL